MVRMLLSSCDSTPASMAHHSVLSLVTNNGSVALTIDNQSADNNLNAHATLKPGKLHAALAGALDRRTHHARRNPVHAYAKTT